MDNLRACQIQALNDHLRKDHVGGQIVMTRGVASRGPVFTAKAVAAVAAYDGFCPDNDPYNEHDFGVVRIDGERLFWKIDYYDQTLTGGADDPADSWTCRRVLTVMLAEEY